MKPRKHTYSHNFVHNLGVYHPLNFKRRVEVRLRGIRSKKKRVIWSKSKTVWAAATLDFSELGKRKRNSISPSVLIQFPSEEPAPGRFFKVFLSWQQMQSTKIKQVLLSIWLFYFSPKFIFSIKFFQLPVFSPVPSTYSTLSRCLLNIHVNEWVNKWTFQKVCLLPRNSYMLTCALHRWITSVRLGDLGGRRDYLWMWGNHSFEMPENILLDLKPC